MSNARIAATIGGIAFLGFLLFCLTANREWMDLAAFHAGQYSDRRASVIEAITPQSTAPSRPANTDATDAEQASAGQDKANPNAQSVVPGTDDLTSVPANAQPDPGKIADPEQYASISGMVADEQGNGVSGAEVTVVATGLTQDVMQDVIAAFSKSDHLHRTRSGRGGAYEITGIAYEGMVIVQAFVEGHIGKAEVSVKAGDALHDVDITLAAGATLVGRVLAPNESPLSGAVVHAMAFLPESRHFSEGAADGHLAWTDESGRFRLGFREKGIAALQVTAQGHPQSLFQDVPVGGANTVTLRLPKPAALEGHVSWRDGNPAEGLTVRLERLWKQALLSDAGTDEFRERGTGPVCKTTIDVNGHYVFETLDPGATFQISVDWRDRTLASEKLGPLLSGQKGVWDRIITDVIHIRGHLYGTTTHRMFTHGYVYCFRKTETKTFPFDEIDANGSFDFELAGETADYRLVPLLVNRVPDPTSPSAKDVHCEPGGSYDVDLFVDEPATLPVRVLDAQSQPVAGASVKVAEMDPGMVYISGEAGRTDEEGRLAVTLTPGKECRANISKEGYANCCTSAHVAQAAETLPEETVVFYAVCGVEGIALGPDGGPLIQAVLRIQVELYNFYSTDALYARTDNSGHFLLRTGLPAAMFSLKFSVEDNEEISPEALAGPVHCEPGQIANIGVIALQFKAPERPAH